MGWPRDVKDLGRRGLPALFALGAASGGLSPARAGDAIDLTAPIPPDSALVTGTLPNGFAYAVRPNGWPENRIDLRLVVRVGSILEEDDQRGLAHFVEHMAFNGSAHFGADALVAYFESIGARFGADLNASTGYDETMYRLDVPADDDSLFDRGLLVLADFAARVAFADSEIERERGVVLDEWRRRQGASERMRRVIDPVLYHGSRYADRDPIGLPDVIQHAPADRIRDFYRRWYRPENMAVVVVGAVDPTHALARIQAHFGELPGPAGGAAAIPAFPVPLHDATLYAVTTDSEARLSTLSLVHKRPRPAFRNLGDIRQSFVRSLVV